ncbi:hypothetical protein AgCh_036809 [Apium graveolens]
MKARYFPNSTFLDAKLGSNLSYMWRSILQSHESIKQGSRRRIGDGGSTDIWKVPWLPCVHNGYLTTVMYPELENVQVTNLMTPSKVGWDTDLLQYLFNNKDTELIKTIPISKNVQQDTWFWILEQSGLFTVKSCYHKLVGEQHWPQASFWHKLWSLELLGKVTNFIWRVCRNVIPTDIALASKRVQISTKCPWCMVKDEDIAHVLFGCSFAHGVWLKVGMQEMNNVDCQGSAWEILFNLVNSCTRDKLVWIVMICWSLWNRRYLCVWDKIVGSETGVQLAATNMLHDWEQAQMVNKIARPVSTGSTRYLSPPPQGWVKVNIDATAFQATESVGLSSVIRNANGKFIRARIKHLFVNLHPREAEAVSLKEALSWVKDLGFRNCVFETDAKTLADSCKGSQGRSLFHTIVLDYREYVLVNFIHTSANVVAHALVPAVHSMSGVGLCRSGFYL